jgi:ABC-2 type transport system permease protein
VLTLIRRTLGRVAVLLSVLAALLAVFQAAIVAVASSLQESHGFERIAGLLPSFIQQGFGPALTSFAGMAGLGFFEPLIVMLVVQFAIYLATEPAGDVEARLVDLTLARPLPRHDLITRSLIVMTIATAGLSATMVAGLYISLWLLAPPGAVWPSTHVVFLLMAHLAAVGWCFGGAALAAAAWSRRRGAAQALVGVGAVALYLAEVVGEAWTRAAWASRLSPFHYFHGSGILSGLTHPAHDLTVLGVVGVSGVMLAYWQFNRRDV